MPIFEMIDSYEVWTSKRMYTTKNIGHYIKNIIDYIYLFIYLYSLDISLCI